MSFISTDEGLVNLSQVLSIRRVPSKAKGDTSYSLSTVNGQNYHIEKGDPELDLKMQAEIVPVGPGFFGISLQRDPSCPAGVFVRKESVIAFRVWRSFNLSAWPITVSGDEHEAVMFPSGDIELLERGSYSTIDDYVSAWKNKELD